MAPGITNRHIILDLDSTLIHSSMDMQALAKLEIYSNPERIPLRSRIYRLELVDVVDPAGTGTLTPMWGILRPYVFDFLVFCSSYFEKIHVWSAGQYKYVHAITDVLFPDSEIRPSTVLTYEDCEMSTTSIFKTLEKIYGKPSSEGANPTNTLALDDREDTFSKNPLNGIQIPIYEPSPTVNGIMTDDIALLQLQCWLSLPEVRNAKDVQTLDKRHIFTTPLSEYSRRLREVLNPTSTPSKVRYELPPSPPKVPPTSSTFPPANTSKNFIQNFFSMGSSRPPPITVSVY